MEQEILDSILKNIDKDEFKRTFDFGKKKRLGFRNYKEFVEFQKKKVKENLETLLFLKSNMKNLCFADKENLTDFPASGFCFNSEGKIVITCER